VTGAVAGFLAGSLAILVAAGPSLLRHCRLRLRFVVDRPLWRQAVGLAAVQSAVAVLANIDLVAGTLLSHDSPSLSGYQVATILSRIPFFLSMAVSTAAFSRMASSRSQASQGTIGAALDVMGSSGFPIAVALATLPPVVARVFLPHAYSAGVAIYLPYTAAIGLLASFTNVLTTLFQAAERYAQCAVLLTAAVLVDGALISAGVLMAGVHGLAVGSLAGQVVALVLIGAAAWRAWGNAIVPGGQAIAMAVLAAPLSMLGAHAALWLAYAIAVCGAGAGVAFLDTGGHLRRLLQPTVETRPRPAVYLLTSQPVSPPWNGGDKNLARTLLRGNLGVDFVFVGRPSDTSRWPARHQRKLVTDSSDLPSGRTKLRLFWSVLAHRPRPDLIHAVMTFRSGLIASLAVLGLLYLTRVPLVMTCPSGRNLPMKLLRRASAVVAVSQSTCATLRASGIGSSHVIPPAVDLDVFRPRPRPSSDGHAGLSAAPTMLFGGHHDAGGGFEEALLLLRAVRGVVPDARMAVAMRRRPGRGDARRWTAARALVEELGLRGAVVEMDGDPGMPTLLPACDVAVYQPRDLGLKMDIPLTLVEAMACGCPVVVSPVDSLVELADGSPAVCIDEPCGPLAVEHVRRLLTDAGYAARARAAARRLAERRYGIEAMHAAYRELYRELIAGEAVPRQAAGRGVAIP
jgi:glycosyltransferase involved in cell wall biosynthesis